MNEIVCFNQAVKVNIKGLHLQFTKPEIHLNFVITVLRGASDEFR